MNNSSSRNGVGSDPQSQVHHHPAPAVHLKQNAKRCETKPTSLKQRLLNKVSSDEDLQKMTEWTPQPSSSSSSQAVMSTISQMPLSTSQQPYYTVAQPPKTGGRGETNGAQATANEERTARRQAFIPEQASERSPPVESLGRIDRSGFLHVAPLVTAHQPQQPAVSPVRMDAAIDKSYQPPGMSQNSEAQSSSEAMPVSDATETRNCSLVLKTETDCVPAADEAVAACSSSGSSSSNSNSTSNTAKGSKTKEVAGRNCAVCDDVASGYHYGVWSCEGCKAFFKRSIQGSAEYVCPATNECTIDKHRRKSCQACRLRKCYTVGMMRGGVRKDRKPGGRSKYKRPADDGSAGENGCPSKRVPTNPILIALMGAECEPVFSDDIINQNEQNYLMKTLINLADRQLLHVINWAKQIPGYTTLELDDQVRLLENSWLEILLISLCYKSMQYKGEKLCFAPGLVVDKEDFAKSGFADLCQHIGAISSKCAMFNVSKEEFVCLKALVLVNSAMELQSQERLLKLQDDLTDALSEAVELTNPTEMRRLPKLLMLLSHLRHLSCKGITQLFEARNSGNVPLYDLLLEMLDANTIVRRQQRQAQEWQQEIKKENTSN